MLPATGEHMEKLKYWFNEYGEVLAVILLAPVLSIIMPDNPSLQYYKDFGMVLTIAGTFFGCTTALYLVMVLNLSERKLVRKMRSTGLSDALIQRWCTHLFLSMLVLCAGILSFITPAFMTFISGRAIVIGITTCFVCNLVPSVYRAFVIFRAIAKHTENDGE